MKKYFVLAIMAMFTLASQAQIVSSRSSRVTTTQGLYEDYSTLYLQWNPSSFKEDDESESFNGFSAGYNHAFSLSQSIPLYLEAGLGVQYSHWSKERSGYEITLNMLSAKVPVSLAYKFDIPNSEFSIVPNVGLDFRFNIIGRMKVKSSYGDESWSVFSDDDMGDDAWKRFQVGWHIGANFMYKSLLLGASYGTDFSEIAEDAKVHTASITLGYCF